MHFQSCQAGTGGNAEGLGQMKKKNKKKNQKTWPSGLPKGITRIRPLPLPSISGLRIVSSVKDLPKLPDDPPSIVLSGKAAKELNQSLKAYMVGSFILDLLKILPKAPKREKAKNPKAATRG